MARHLLVTLLCTTLTSATLVPSTNIYRPAWLNLRRARGASSTLNNQNQISVPRPLSPRDQQLTGNTFSTGRSFSSSSAGSGYIVSPAAAFPAYDIVPSQRLIYASISPPRSYFALPTFTKRLDELSPVKASGPQSAPTPCSLLASASSGSSIEPADSSHLHPIYVLPPKNFQPIIYQPNSIYQPLPVQILQPVNGNRKTSGSGANSPSEEALWYVKGEARSPSDNGLENENDLENSRRRVLLIPVSDNSFHPFPIYEASVEKLKPEKTFDSESMSSSSNNPYNNISKRTPVITEDNKPKAKDNRRLKTKLPVGMTSFFLGGVRGVSGRHWRLPSDIVRQMEFMPNASPVSPESKYLPEDGYVTKQLDEKPKVDSTQPGYVTEVEEEEAKGTLVSDSKNDNDIGDKGIENSDIASKYDAADDASLTPVKVPSPGVKAFEEKPTPIMAQ